MQAEGELRSNLEESDRVRDLQDKVADMKAEVSLMMSKAVDLL
jgi:ecotropic viral integration site 5 protein